MNDALRNFDPEVSRPVATADEYISIKEAQEIFTAHGRAITERTLQRYCDKHHLQPVLKGATPADGG